MTQDFINFAVTRKARFSADKAAHATSRLSGCMKGQFARTEKILRIPMVPRGHLTQRHRSPTCRRQ